MYHNQRPRQRSTINNNQDVRHRSNSYNSNDSTYGYNEYTSRGRGVNRGRGGRRYSASSDNNGERFNSRSGNESQHRTNHNSGLKLRLPNFSGDEEEWKSFKSQYELMAFTLNWSEKEKLLQLLTALDTKSRSYIDNSFSSLLTTTSGEVLEKLNERFSATDVDHYRSLLFMQKFRANDNVVAYTDNLRSLARRAFPSETHKFIEDIIKTALFRSVVDKDLAKHLTTQRRQLESVEDMMKAIQAYQSIEGFDPRSNEYAKHKPQHRQNPAYIKAIDMVAPEEEDDDHEQNDYLYKMQQRERDYNKVTCNHCSGIGHYQNECPSKPRIKCLNAWTSTLKPKGGSSQEENNKTGYTS